MLQIIINKIKFLLVLFTGKHFYPFKGIKKSDLLIFDDIYPNTISGFRLEEFNVLLTEFEKSKIILSGNKWESKEYIRYTGYPGGQRSLTANELFAKDPTRLVEKSVKGMLPKNTLGRQLFTNLKVYKGTEHNHEAQKPTVINLDTFK